MSLARVTATRASRGLPFRAIASALPPDPGGDDPFWRNEPDALSS
jgi:hypothetical protein